MPSVLCTWIHGMMTVLQLNDTHKVLGWGCLASVFSDGAARILLPPSTAYLDWCIDTWGLLSVVAASHLGPWELLLHTMCICARRCGVKLQLISRKSRCCWALRKRGGCCASRCWP